MSGRKRCALLVTCLAIAAGFEGTRVVAVQGASCFANPPAGAVQGVDNGSSCSFLGVPYVAAPTGSQRWRPPQALAPWTGVRDATVPPTNCSTIILPAGTLSGIEDCLKLNLWVVSHRGVLRRLSKFSRT